MISSNLQNQYYVGDTYIHHQVQLPAQDIALAPLGSQIQCVDSAEEILHICFFFDDAGLFLNTGDPAPAN